MARPTLQDDPFPEEWDFEPVRNWIARRLEGRSASQIRFLVGRTALRALPFQLANILRNISGEQGHDLDLAFRCNLFAISSGYFALPERIDYMRAAFKSSQQASQRGLSSAALAASFAAAEPTVADAATMFVRHTACASDVFSGIRTRDPQFLPARRLYLPDEQFYLAFADDCEVIDFANARIANHKLWPFNRWRSVERFATENLVQVHELPSGISSLCIESLERIKQLPGDFAVWVEWYEGILAGETNERYLFDLTFSKGQMINVKFGLIDDALWKGDPALLHKEMRRLIEVTRAEQSSGRLTDTSPPTVGTKRPAKKAIRPKTAVGKAMVTNVAPIALQTALLIPLIEREIERIKAERPNSGDAIAAQTEHIQKLEKLKTDTLELQLAATSLAAEKISEKEALKKANEFFKPFRDCWNKDGESFVRAGISSGIFLGAVSIAHLHGMTLPPLITVTVLGAIAAEKPLVNVLKSAKGILKIGS